MKSFINKSLIKTFGYHLAKYRSKEDLVFGTQTKLSASAKKPIIFDVGAFTGETALTYNAYFKGSCEIHSFEPYPDSFETLRRVTDNFNNIKVYNLALGNRIASAQLHVNNFLATNSLLSSSADGIETWGKDLLETKSKIEVPMQTIDAFIEKNKINQIDILKMDTQGSEYMVLEGAKNAIMSGKIKVIYSELIVMPIYEGQKELHEMLGLFKDYGFELYNLFTSKDKDERIRFMDGIFVFKN